MTILQRFIFGEVFYIGNLSDHTRELITITALATNQTLPQLRAHANAALKHWSKTNRDQGSDLSISTIHWLSESVERFRYYQHVFSKTGDKTPFAK
jgi:predicted transposase YbfD/YdcC